MEYCIIMNRLFCFIVLIITGGILLSQPVAAKKQPLVLKPSSKWIASYDDDSCRLIRQFGTEKQSVTAIFSRFGPGDRFQLTLAGEPFKLRSSSRPARLQFGPTEEVQEISFFVGSLGEDIPALIFSGGMRIAAMSDAETKALKTWNKNHAFKFEPISAERQAAVTQLSMGRPLRQPVVLEIGSMEKPFSALSSCIEELQTHWGIDVTKHKNLTREAQPDNNPGSWVNANDYPTDMLRRGQPAVVQFRLSIDGAGQVTACHIQRTTRPKEFDDAVCKSLLKRASFLPALDAEEKPIASYWQSTVRFQIPR